MAKTIKSKYSLRWNPNKNITATQYSLYAISIAALIVLSWVSTAITPAIAPSISFLYIVTPLLVLFTLWWGGWGLLGCYLGTVIGGGLMVGAPPIQALVASTADVIPMLLIFLLYRGYLANRGVDPFCRDITKKKSLAWFIFWVMIVTNIIGAFWGVWTLQLFGVIPQGAFWAAAGLWALGGAIMLAFVPVISRKTTPLLERYGLIVNGWIT